MQYGEKAGVSQFINGISTPVKPEKTLSYEWGLKSSLFDNTLILNTALFVMDVKNYQQTTRVFDAYNTALAAPGSPPVYTNGTGNVAKVRAKGLEIDGVWAPVPAAKVRFAGAYNDARYVGTTLLGAPVELGYAGAPLQIDANNRQLPGAAKWTGNVGLDYRVPAFGGNSFHFNTNTTYSSRYYSDTSLSEYSIIQATSITDLAIGFSTPKQAFDFSFLVKNAFDQKRPLSQTWNSYTPAVPRWVGVVVSGAL